MQKDGYTGKSFMYFTLSLNHMQTYVGKEQKRAQE